MSTAPESYKQAGMLMVVSGVANLMLGLLYGFLGFTTCLGSYGLCCFCPFLGLIPLFVGIYELSVGSAMRNGVYVEGARTANIIGLVMGVMTFSMINVVLEAIVLMQLGQPDAVAWLENRGQG